MKQGCLSIDGNDVYTQYGVYVVKGGWNELVAFPPLKAVDYNEWQEFDGIEADLSNPVLNTREVTIKFASNGDYDSFLSMLLDSAFHTFTCGEIGRNYSLRLVQQTNMAKSATLGTFALKFADDFPMNRTSHIRVSPTRTFYGTTGWRLGTLDFSDYGVRVLTGSTAELEKRPNVRKNLLRNIATKTGAMYDDGMISVQSRDVRLNCLMVAGNLNTFWNNYNTLLYDLIQPDERKLTVNSKDYYFYYKSCTVTEFIPYGKPWMKFTLTLCLTR